MGTSRGPNRQMEHLCGLTGWSRTELARRVNQRARIRGIPLNADASPIRYWLAGQHPQPPVPELLCELFSEQLGYPITPTDIGLRATHDYELGLRYSESITATVVAVAELGRYDVRRRGFLRDGAFLAVAAVAPSRDWLLAVLEATESRPRSRIGMAQVNVIRETFAAFQEADVMRGGGHARQALADYLTSRVLPLLHDADPQSDVGTALFTAASEQTYLLGWMAFDDGKQALAQRYLIQALRLAQESGDTALGAHVLAGMADQARMLGHPREALQLATTGRHGLIRVFNPACSADLWALQARAHATLGEEKKAAHAVVESERAFE
ncbi:MAG: transcriptional regulator, partial [Actinobacteria bacterium]|nr:transcriptional regulator [Actinomycetota bacterium]